jgi:protocatechuate 3,4-dioxygenase beta subunit
MKTSLGLLLVLAGGLVVNAVQTAGEPGARPKFTGTVLDADGKPAPEVKVSLFPSFWQGEKATDAEGRFTLLTDQNQSGGTSAGRVVIARDFARNLSAALKLDDEATNAELKLEPALTLAGRVTDPSGQAVTNAQARVMFQSERISLTMGSPIRTDVEGRFEFKALPPGRSYGVSISAKGFAPENRSVDAPDAGTRRVELDPFRLLPTNQRIAGVVLDADGQPVPGAWINSSGERQPSLNLLTDAEGRFSFDRVCAGEIRLSANVPGGGGHGAVVAEGGDTNIIIRVSVSPSALAEVPRRASLEGKSLPDLTTVNLASDAVPAGKQVLVCLADVEQRPSRRVLRLLAEQHDALRQKGVTVLAVQAAVTSTDSLKEWKDANPVPFAVGRVAEKSDKTKWALEVESFPWLILTDAQGRVTAEGFAFDELDAKLSALAK